MGKRNPVVCCSMCGRDTSARGGVCVRCLGGKAGALCKDDMRGRKGRRVTENLDAIDDAPAPHDSQSLYHGETPRDDI